MTDRQQMTPQQKTARDAELIYFQTLIQTGVIHQSQARVMQFHLGSWHDAHGGPWFDGDKEKVENMAGSRQVCPECRVVMPIIVTCSHANKIWVGPKWRAPKKTNDRAWKRIAGGDIMWDHSAIEAKAKKEAQSRLSAEELLRRKKRRHNELLIHTKMRG